MRMADALPWPLVALGAEGQCLGSNRAGARALVDGRVLRRDEQGRVVASEPARRADWDQALRRAAAGELVALHWAGRRQPLQGLLRRLSGGPGPMELMLTLSPDGAAGLDLQAYAQQHGLSPAEARVLALLAEGLDAAAVAARLGVSLATVRAQLQALRRKTRQPRTAGVLLELSRLPPRLAGPM